MLKSKAPRVPNSVTHSTSVVPNSLRKQQVLFTTARETTPAEKELQSVRNLTEGDLKALLGKKGDQHQQQEPLEHTHPFVDNPNLGNFYRPGNVHTPTNREAYAPQSPFVPNKQTGTLRRNLEEARAWQNQVNTPLTSQKAGDLFSSQHQRRGMCDIPRRADVESLKWAIIEAASGSLTTADIEKKLEKVLSEKHGYSTSSFTPSTFIKACEEAQKFIRDNPTPVRAAGLLPFLNKYLIASSRDTSPQIVS